MKKVVIYGAGAYGQILFYDVEKYGDIDIVAFAVDQAYWREDRVCGLPVVPFEEVERLYPPNEYNMIVACGYTVMRNRKIMYEKAKLKGYKLINYVSSRAMLETDIIMGDNNIIMANAFVGYDGIMGNDNVIRQNVYLGHQFKIGNHSIISPGCTLGGKAAIGDLVFIGIGVSARSYIVYGDESLIGVGSNVVRNVEPYVTIAGNPAKVMGYHQDTGVIVKEVNHE